MMGGESRLLGRVDGVEGAARILADDVNLYAFGAFYVRVDGDEAGHEITLQPAGKPYSLHKRQPYGLGRIFLSESLGVPPKQNELLLEYEDASYIAARQNVKEVWTSLFEAVKKEEKAMRKSKHWKKLKKQLRLVSVGRFDYFSSFKEANGEPIIPETRVHFSGMKLESLL